MAFIGRGSYDGERGASGLSGGRVRAATDRLLDRGPRTRWLEWLVTGAGIAALSLVSAHSIAGMSGKLPKPLLLIVALAGASILLTITSEQIVLGWLFLAPIFQESAGNTRMGHMLALGLYTAPPAIFLFKLLTSHEWRPRRQWFDFVPGIYVAFVFLSLAITASSELKTGTVGTLRNFYQDVALGPLVYYVVAFWRGRQLPVVRVFRLLLIAAALQAVMSTIELFTGRNLWGDMSWQQGGDVRSIATLGNPSLTGAFIGMGIVVAVSILSWAGPAQLRRLAVVMIIVGLPGIYATKTRGPILSTVFAATICLLLSSRARAIGVGVIALVALTLVLFWPSIKSSTVYQNRFDQKQNVEARVVLQQVSIKLAEQKPVLGWGYNSFDRVKFKVQGVSSTAIPLAQALQSTSHDTYLTMLVEYGAVGLLIFALPWGVILLGAVRRARPPSPDRWVFLAGLTSVTVIGLTAATLDYRFFSFVPMLAWFFLGILRRQGEAEAGQALARA